MNSRFILHRQRISNDVDVPVKSQPESAAQSTASVKVADETRTATRAAEFFGRKWGMRLLFVDEQVIRTFLSRLLATGLRESLLKSRAIGDFREEINKAKIPADLNMSLLAVCLLEASEGLIPEVGQDPEPYLDQPTWLEGTVTGVEPVYGRQRGATDHSQSAMTTSLGLRLRSDDGIGMLLRLNNAISPGWERSDLKSARIQAIGLLCRPRYRHVTAAAISQLDASVTPKRRTRSDTSPHL